MRHGLFIVATLVAVLALSAQASHAVVWDGQESSAATSTDGPSLTWSHDASAAGSDKILVLGVTLRILTGGVNFERVSGIT